MGSLHGLFCSSKRFSAQLSGIGCFVNQFFKHKLSTCTLQVPKGTFGRERPQNVMWALWTSLIARVKHAHKKKHRSQIFRWGVEMAPNLTLSLGKEVNFPQKLGSQDCGQLTELGNKDKTQKTHKEQ
ncbi:UNVERIFIED_CONTAM: hypothetical protein K2H54_075144 [Gekko kuhli]